MSDSQSGGDGATPTLAKLSAVSSGSFLALLIAYHTTIFMPAITEMKADFAKDLVEHSSRPHPGVSAGLAEVRTNEAKIELLSEEIGKTETRIDVRLERIEDKIDRLAERVK